MLASFTSFAQCAISDWMNFASSAGFIGAGIDADHAVLLFTSGLARLFTAASCTFCTTSGGSSGRRHQREPGDQLVAFQLLGERRQVRREGVRFCGGDRKAAQLAALRLRERIAQVDEGEGERAAPSCR
jgi:hypothetical protein